MPSPILASIDACDESAAEAVRRGATLAHSRNTKLIIAAYNVDRLELSHADESMLRRAALPLDSEHIEWVQMRDADFISCIRTAIERHNPAWVCVPQRALHKTKHILRLSLAKRLVESVSAPLWIVAPPDQRKPTVLAAVDPAHEHGKTAHLDQLILEYAMWIARLVGAELHVLHAVFAFDAPRSIISDLQVVRREHLAELLQPLDVPPSQLHVPIDLPSKAIEQYVADLNPMVLVMGAVKRKVWHRVLVGSTTREIVAKLNCDIVTLMPNAPSLK